MELTNEIVNLLRSVLGRDGNTTYPRLLGAEVFANTPGKTRTGHIKETSAKLVAATFRSPSSI